MHYKKILLAALLLAFVGLFACHSAQKSSKTTRQAPTRTAQNKPKTDTAPHAPATETSAQGIPVQSAAKYVAWLDSERLMPVLEQAQRENKGVFVEFTASWCAPCKVMEEEVFTQRDVFRYLNSNFLNFKTDIDTEAGRAIADIHEVKGLPTIIFLSPNGVVLERHLGLANPSTIFDLGDSALEQMGK